MREEKWYLERMKRKAWRIRGKKKIQSL